MNEHDTSSMRQSNSFNRPAAADAATGDRQHAIDRLVAGDLGESERAELLAWLEAQPQRWRSCALTFLEAEMWREGFGEFRGAAPSVELDHAVEPAPVASELPVTAPSPKHRDQTRRAWGPVAAAVVVAFTLGIAFDATWRTWYQPPDNASSIVKAIDQKLDHSDSLPTSEPSGRNQVEDLSPRTVAMLTIRPDESDGSKEMTIPVLDSAGAAAQLGLAERPPLSDYDRRRLERQGYRVTQSRGFVPIALADGRQIVIPVDQVKLQHIKQIASY